MLVMDDKFRHTKVIRRRAGDACHVAGDKLFNQISRLFSPRTSRHHVARFLFVGRVQLSFHSIYSRYMSQSTDLSYPRRPVQIYH